jgi:eukaryotic-like serine/threonine-protein kinase
MTRSDTTAEVARRRGPATDTSRIGTIIGGRYRLEALIGRGGMGVVYRAAHTGLRKQVAIKVLHPSLASSPEVRTRFEREALAIGKIDHPNCVGVFDMGTMDDDSIYLVMELLEGKSLGDVLDEEGQIPPTRALHILKHILTGLSHVHQVDLVHRDIKPENVYLVSHGEDRDFAKILDFGIAKPMKSSDLDDGVKLTQAGVAFGTPIYMSPEQAIGNPIDGRADLYSAAALGFEMLTGQPPFYSDDKLEVMSMHTTRPTPPMSSRLIKGGTPVSEAIERVIAKGLAKRPSERYQSAEEFIRELNELMEVGGATEVEIRPLRRITGAMPLTMTSNGVAIDSSGARPIPSRPMALPGVAPLPGDTATSPSGNQTTGVLVRAPARIVSVSMPNPTVTPEYTPSLGRPWWVYPAAAVLAAAIGIGIATFTVPRGKKLAVEGPVAAAVRANQNGTPAIALQILEQNRDKIQNDPLGLLELGHAASALNKTQLAIGAYESALKLAPELQSGSFIRSNIKTMSEDKAETEEDQKVVEKAFELLLLYFELPDTQGRLIATTANPEASWRRRHAALKVAETYKLDGKLDRFAVYSLDLAQVEDCEGRKEVISRLRALGDPRAIEPLKEIVAKYSEPAPTPPKRKPKGRAAKQAAAKAAAKAARARKKGDCLVDDAETAITYLRELEAQQKGTPLPPPGGAGGGKLEGDASEGIITPDVADPAPGASGASGAGGAGEASATAPPAPKR